jgi:hypothetical protein
LDLSGSINPNRQLLFIVILLSQGTQGASRLNAAAAAAVSLLGLALRTPTIFGNPRAPKDMALSVWKRND